MRLAKPYWLYLMSVQAQVGITGPNQLQSCKGWCWEELDVYTCSGTCFLRSFWFGKENICTRASPALLHALQPSLALQVLALTNLGTHRAIPMPRPGSGLEPDLEPLEPPCSRSSVWQTTRANATCHRTDKRTEVETTILVCRY